MAALTAATLTAHVTTQRGRVRPARQHRLVRDATRPGRREGVPDRPARRGVESELDVCALARGEAFLGAGELYG